MISKYKKYINPQNYQKKHIHIKRSKQVYESNQVFKSNRDAKHELSNLSPNISITLLNANGLVSPIKQNKKKCADRTQRKHHCVLYKRQR